MTSMKRGTRDTPLTYTVAASAITTTHGKMAVVYADVAALSVDARGTVAADAHFPLVKADSDARPPRYIDVLHPAIGAGAADTDALVYVEFWHENAAEWASAEPFRACGRTVIAAAAAADPPEYISEFHTVDVPRGAIAGRFYITGLVATTGLDLAVDADNDD